MDRDVNERPVMTYNGLDRLEHDPITSGVQDRDADWEAPPGESGEEVDDNGTVNHNSQESWDPDEFLPPEEPAPPVLKGHSSNPGHESLDRLLAPGGCQAHLPAREDSVDPGDLEGGSPAQAPPQAAQPRRRLPRPRARVRRAYDSGREREFSIPVERTW